MTDYYKDSGYEQFGKARDSDLFDEKEEIIAKEENLKVIETFSKSDNEILEKVKRRKIENPEIVELRKRSEEAAILSGINKLISYDMIKGNLEYNLPHQQENALKILRDMDGRVLLADEVGLGKTITAGMVLKECIVRGFVKKALILAPPSLIEQWICEMREKFGLKFKRIEREHEWENTPFAIASIDTVKRFNEKLKKFEHAKAHQIYWDVLIIDEAHKLKNKKTERWKFVDKLQKKRLLLLTATPFQNDLIELYNLLYLLKRGHLGTISNFKSKFMESGTNKRHPINISELKRKLGEVMIRTRRKDTEIKPSKRSPKVHVIKFTEQERENYENSIKLIFDLYFNYKDKKIPPIMIPYVMLPKISSSCKSAMESMERIAKDPKYHQKTRDFAYELYKDYKSAEKDSKIEKVVEVIKEIIRKDKDDKILVYTKHPATLKYIAAKLQQLRIKTVEYLGGLDATQKSRVINKFEKEVSVMISTDTGAEGLNLQFCNNLVNYDLPWNPMAVEQRIGRLDRIGQKKNIVHIYTFAVKDTMEEKIVDLIINKMCCVGLIMGELPIILFNMGLDSQYNKNITKVEERIMKTYLDSKDNLRKFEQGIDEFSEEIDKGTKEYEETKESTSELLD